MQHRPAELTMKIRLEAENKVKVMIFLARRVEGGQLHSRMDLFILDSA
jgi:hypothetical protein